MPTKISRNIRLYALGFLALALAAASAAPRGAGVFSRPRLVRAGRRQRSDGTGTGWNLAGFFALAYGWSWGCWLLVPGARGWSAGVASGLMFAGGFGPTLAAAGLVLWAGGWAGLRAWGARCLRGRVGWGWVAVAVGGPLAVVGLAAAVHVGLGGALPPSPVRGHGGLAVANVGLILLLGGPLGEEFGWRGYALPALRGRWGWRVGSLLLGVGWGGWHLPLFFLDGSSQRHVPVALFVAGTTALSVLFAGLAQRTGGSLVPALLLHTAVNYWSWAVPIVPDGGSLRPFALATGLAVALALLALGGRGRRAGHSPSTPAPA